MYGIKNNLQKFSHRFVARILSSTPLEDRHRVLCNYSKYQYTKYSVAFRPFAVVAKSYCNIYNVATIVRTIFSCKGKRPQVPAVRMVRYGSMWGSASTVSGAIGFPIPPSDFYNNIRICKWQSV